MGSTLYPLNTLRQKWPSMYATYAAKYVGRETLMEQTIPALSCRWNDVLHFCPVHPDLIRKGLMAAGYEPKPSQWFVIDPIALDFNSNNTVIYLYLAKKYRDFTKRADDFKSFESASLAEFCELPEATVAHYQNSYQTGNIPLLFHRIPHVLHRGHIPIHKMTVIRS
ncbi:MAG: hypothetical protein AAF609_19655 [Cyanobacteria bacterium P01_C01_bin.120]